MSGLTYFSGHAPCKAGLLTAVQKSGGLTCGPASSHPLGTGGSCSYEQMEQPASCHFWRLWVGNGEQIGALLTLVSRAWEEAWSPSFRIAMFRPANPSVYPSCPRLIWPGSQKQPLTTESMGLIYRAPHHRSNVTLLSRTGDPFPSRSRVQCADYTLTGKARQLRVLVWPALVGAQEPKGGISEQGLASVHWLPPCSRTPPVKWDYCSKWGSWVSCPPNPYRHLSLSLSSKHLHLMPRRGEPCAAFALAPFWFLELSSSEPLASGSLSTVCWQRAT